VPNSSAGNNYMPPLRQRTGPCGESTYQVDVSTTIHDKIGRIPVTNVIRAKRINSPRGAHAKSPAPAGHGDHFAQFERRVLGK
jgi:hypothetical protein